jgi:TPR repeat protein
MSVYRYGAGLALCLALGACSPPPSFEKGEAAYQAQDYAGALKQWAPLADKGDARAETALGDLYYDGKGVTRDPGKAAHWFVLAAAGGSANAETGLGTLYMTGQGVPQDFAKAREQFAKAAAQGQPLAAYDLATLYDNGQGGPADKTQAVRYYQEAAEFGDDAAAMNLGVQYANGEGAPQDMVQAYKWTAVAASLTRDPEVKSRADANLAQMSARMAPQDIHAGEQAAAAFKPKVRTHS